MSVHATDGTSEFLARMAFGPVHQLSLRLLPAACHLEPPGPIAEVRLGRSLNLLPGRQWNEAHLRQPTRSGLAGVARQIPVLRICCTFKAHGQYSVTGHTPVPCSRCNEAAYGKEDANMLQPPLAAESLHTALSLSMQCMSEAYTVLSEPSQAAASCQASSFLCALNVNVCLDHTFSVYSLLAVSGKYACLTPGSTINC